ncbi:hypothetical protein BCY84_06251 [Trypanosoma cruzi cruzi]|nr:hypothetical protein BCY84_06251 [Trypanosoma cruzi cruzi]
MHIAVDLNASFCSACWQLRVAAVVFRGHEEKGGGERERTPSLLSCVCDAPRVTALSWAPCPIDGGMAGNIVPRDGWMRVRLLIVWLVWWLRCFYHFPGAAEMTWGRWWWMPSPPAWWVAAGVVCHPCVDAVSWCVDCAAGPAALSSCSPLSLAVSAALRPSPSCCIPFPSASRIGSLTPATPPRAMMTAMVTVRRRVGPCALVLLLLVRVRDGCWESWTCIWCCGCGGCAGGCVVCSE